MLAAILLGITTVSLTPTDDIWVYPHSSDPARDANLRIWGSDDKPAATSVSDLEQFSYSFLKFPVESLTDQKPKAARLILWSVAKPTFTVEQSKRAPLQVRPVSPDFTEKAWTYDQAEKLMPDASEKVVFGETSVTDISGTVPLRIEIDLLKGPGKFADYLVNAKRSSKPFAVALTAALDVTDNRSSYKIYSRDAERESLRPKLEIDY
jgi:hypothetical protein